MSSAAPPKCWLSHFQAERAEPKSHSFTVCSRSWMKLLAHCCQVLKEKPFALFGHSFGAFTSLAVAEALKRLHNLEPVHLFLSGASAPYSEMRLSAPKRSHLSDEDFLKWLTVAGGTPPELLANPQVLQLFLPALKADLHLVENYSCPPPECPLLSCPVTCFDGSDDVPHDLQG
ncbi:hypothetical protein fugu_018471 [Takifugu bimaculatus]|uniref:oleoyl-[acyl-carrier-protein] hydrolase n=1 Tax=Takifugu bimaculatus TaxID=433685 RepID=A0A4Z2BM21_9TELE|nr:hypothetical protein fugu_018471 [Takifugu bimaculatus]